MYKVQLTEEELNVLTNGLSFILIQNSRENNLSKEAADHYVAVKSKLENIRAWN